MDVGLVEVEVQDRGRVGEARHDLQRVGKGEGYQQVNGWWVAVEEGLLR